MAKTLTATDRSALIRLASTLPVGSDERRAILAGLKKVGRLPPEISPLVKALQTEAKRAAPKWERNRSFKNKGFKKVWVGDNLRGVSIQFIYGDPGFLPMGIGVDLNRREWEVSNSDHQIVWMPLETPPADLLKSLWKLQGKVRVRK